VDSGACPQRAPAHWLLAVEVVSPTSRKTDRFFKPIEYAQAGIPAYWRLELEPAPLLVVHRLAGERYDVVQELTGEGLVEVPFRVRLDLPALLPPLAD
jgi:Uma2 family endonuclease